MKIWKVKSRDNETSHQMEQRDHNVAGRSFPATKNKRLLSLYRCGYTMPSVWTSQNGFNIRMHCNKMDHFDLIAVISSDSNSGSNVLSQNCIVHTHTDTHYHEHHIMQTCQAESERPANQNQKDMPTRIRKTCQPRSEGHANQSQKNMPTKIRRTCQPELERHANQSQKDMPTRIRKTCQPESDKTFQP